MKKNLLTIVMVALVAMCANAQDKVSTATTWDGTGCHVCQCTGQGINSYYLGF